MVTRSYPGLYELPLTVLMRFSLIRHTLLSQLQAYPVTVWLLTLHRLKKSNRKHECCVNKVAWRSTVLSAIVCEREDIEPDLRLVKFPYCVVLPSISNTSNIENYWLLAQIWFSSNLIFKGRCGAVVTRHLSDMSSNPIKDPRCFLEQNVLHSLFTLRDIWQIYIYVK